MTNESAYFIEPKIVFGEIQLLLENNFSLFQIHRKKPYPLLNVMLALSIVKCFAGNLVLSGNAIHILTEECSLRNIC